MENILEINDIYKSYEKVEALSGINFNIPETSIYGLLGPNGAGKTTLIRIITQIIAADKGNIKILGENLRPNHIYKIGYLPEERGLYSKMKVGEHLVYLGQLKGLSKSKAKKRIEHWFEKFEIKGWWNKKIRELSKGMQQKIQFIATVLHDPKILILDEPFTGLDPVNTQLLKDEIRAMKENGVTIIFSTHRMEQVEEICEEITLVNKGQAVITGKVDAIKKRLKKNNFKVILENPEIEIDEDFFKIVKKADDCLTINLSKEKTPNQLLRNLIEKTEVHEFREILPTLNEIFIEQVKGKSDE